MMIHLTRLSMTNLPRGVAALALVIALVAPLHAQEPSDWNTGVDLRGGFPPEMGTVEQPNSTGDNPLLPNNTTVITRTPSPDQRDTQSAAQIKLVALLTADGQQIDQGVVWRVYEATQEATAKSKLLMTENEASPTIELEPGQYIVNAAFGRAHLTRMITVQQAGTTIEQFVLNAGGLRVKVLVDGAAPAPNSVAFNIDFDERDQFANRARIISGAKPNLIIRLNAGIYHILSTYGDANAKVEADVTVEAGKLTEATIAHTAARVSFKLVTRAGGEALPDTQWTVQTSEGRVIKRSVGALPSHILAPGTYTIIAKSGTRAFKREFTLASGDVTQVEVLMR